LIVLSCRTIGRLRFLRAFCQISDSQKASHCTRTNSCYSLSNANITRKYIEHIVIEHLINGFSPF
jgi:hypothetical protein